MLREQQKQEALERMKKKPPRETFFASIKTDPLQKVLDMEYKMSDGTVYKPYSEEDKKEIRQYRTLGRCDADMVLWIQKECERVGLDSYIVLNELEENLRELVKGNTENVEPEIQKWFDGELDKEFYHADRNDMYFKDYFMQKVKEELELNQLEENLGELIKRNTENVEPEIQKWFDGELDKEFYYEDKNGCEFN